MLQPPPYERIRCRKSKHWKGRGGTGARGRAPSTQAGEFIREQIEHIRKGKHGARSTNRRSPSASRRRAGPANAQPAAKKGRQDQRPDSALGSGSKGRAHRECTPHKRVVAAIGTDGASDGYC